MWCGWGAAMHGSILAHMNRSPMQSCALWKSGRDLNWAVQQKSCMHLDMLAIMPNICAILPNRMGYEQGFAFLGWHYYRHLCAEPRPYRLRAQISAHARLPRSPKRTKLAQNSGAARRRRCSPSDTYSRYAAHRVSTKQSRAFGIDRRRNHAGGG